MSNVDIGVCELQMLLCQEEIRIRKISTGRVTVVESLSRAVVGKVDGRILYIQARGAA